MNRTCRGLASRATAALASVSPLVLMLAAPTHSHAQIFKWTGFYAGGYVGGAWSGANATTSVGCNEANNPPAYFCSTTSPANGAAVAASGTGGISGARFTGGAQAGYNFQYRDLVLGVEVDFGSLKLTGTRSTTANYVANFNVGTGNVYTIKNSFDADWLFTARGRVGTTIFAPILAYVTGGVALTSLKTTNSFSDNLNTGASGSWQERKIRAGWVLGGGGEWALGRNWTAKIEYLYVDFGSVFAAGTIRNPGFGAAYAQAISTSLDLTAHIARVGVGFKF